VAKPKRDRIREERIHNEAIVDAYGPEEQALGWYYYLENNIEFPFAGRCIAPKVVSPLRKGETVEVRGLAPEDSCAHDMLVLIRWHGRNVAVPLSQLTAIDADEFTVKAIEDWHYWLAQGYCF
jgi:Calcium binding